MKVPLHARLFTRAVTGFPLLSLVTDVKARESVLPELVASATSSPLKPLTVIPAALAMTGRFDIAVSLGKEMLNLYSFEVVSVFSERTLYVVPDAGDSTRVTRFPPAMSPFPTKVVERTAG